MMNSVIIKAALHMRLIIGVFIFVVKQTLLMWLHQKFQYLHSPNLCSYYWIRF